MRSALNNEKVWSDKNKDKKETLYVFEFQSYLPKIVLKLRKGRARLSYCSLYRVPSYVYLANL